MNNNQKKSSEIEEKIIRDAVSELNSEYEKILTELSDLEKDIN